MVLLLGMLHLYPRDLLHERQMVWARHSIAYIDCRQLHCHHGRVLCCSRRKSKLSLNPLIP